MARLLRNSADKSRANNWAERRTKCERRAERQRITESEQRAKSRTTTATVPESISVAIAILADPTQETRLTTIERVVHNTHIQEAFVYSPLLTDTRSVIGTLLER